MARPSRLPGTGYILHWRNTPKYGILNKVGSPGAAKMQLGNAIAWQCICATGYAAAVVAFGGESASVLSALVNEWVTLTIPFVRAVVFFLPEPANTPDAPGPMAIYQHIMVSSLLIACAWICALRSSWDNWGNDAYFSANRQARKRSLKLLLRDARYMTILGASSAMLLLLFLGTESSQAQSWLVTEKWTYFRAPLLGTAFFAFACYFVAIRRLLQSSSREPWLSYD